jgi:predicted lipoprotein with Yx(FWY)xxD motif
MPNFNIDRSRSARRTSRVARAVAVAAAAATVVLAGTGASASASPVLRSVSFGGFSNALANHSSRTLYVLSNEKGGHIRCQTACMILWLPLEVKDSVTTIATAAKVDGKIGFVARGKTMKQVTFNSYPVYTYTGDTASHQSNGEGVAADGGTWYVVHATSTSAVGTLLKSSSSTTTTTTRAGGGYGY